MHTYVCKLDSSQPMYLSSSDFMRWKFFARQCNSYALGRPNVWVDARSIENDMIIYHDARRIPLRIEFGRIMGDYYRYNDDGNDTAKYRSSIRMATLNSSMEDIEARLHKIRLYIEKLHAKQSEMAMYFITQGVTNIVIPHMVESKKASKPIIAGYETYNFYISPYDSMPVCAPARGGGGGEYIEDGIMPTLNTEHARYLPDLNRLKHLLSRSNKMYDIQAKFYALLEMHARGYAELISEQYRDKATAKISELSEEFVNQNRLRSHNDLRLLNFKPTSIKLNGRTYMMRSKQDTHNTYMREIEIIHIEHTANVEKLQGI